MRDFTFSEIKFSDGHNPIHDKMPIVQVLRATRFTHPQYGEILITPEILLQMKENFEANVRRVNLAIDYGHNNGEEAAGWIKELFLAENNTELWARVDWTKNALQKLNEREYRYFSPEFAFEWTDAEKNISYKNVLFGGGLTNRPQVKDMSPIVLKEIKGETMEAKVKELEAQIVKLNEQVQKYQGDMAAMQANQQAMPEGSQAEADAEKKQIEELMAKIADMQKQIDALSANNAGMLAEKQKMMKETEFSVLLSEGKACVAQKESYVAGDLLKFISLAQPINLAERGATSSTAAGKSGDAQDQVLKLAEEKQKADSKLTISSAIRLVLQENKDLAKSYNETFN